MWNARLDEAQAGIKIARRNINNLKYAGDTTLMAESEEELKSLLMKVKEEREKVGLTLNIQKTKIMDTGPITSWQIGKQWKQWETFFLSSKITAEGDCSHEIKRFLFLGRKFMTNLDSILKSRDITLPMKICLVKAMVFPVFMYGCESWTIKKAEHWRNAWCFWTVVLEKTLESPLDCKENQPVHPKGNQPWIFIGRTDAEAEIPKFWPPDVKSWLIWKGPDAGKVWRREEKGMTEDEMVGLHHQLDGHKFKWAPGFVDGQGSLACCSPWGHKELDTTEQLNWTDWYRVSYNLQIVTDLPLPFNLDTSYFFFCLNVPARISNTMLNRSGRVGILVLFHSLVGRLSAFHHWVLCWLWVCHKWLLLCWDVFPL